MSAGRCPRGCRWRRCHAACRAHGPRRVARAVPRGRSARHRCRRPNRWRRCRGRWPRSAGPTAHLRPRASSSSPGPRRRWCMPSTSRCRRSRSRASSCRWTGCPAPVRPRPHAAHGWRTRRACCRSRWHPHPARRDIRPGTWSGGHLHCRPRRSASHLRRGRSQWPRLRPGWWSRPRTTC